MYVGNFRLLSLFNLLFNSMWQQAVGKRGELLALGFLQVNSFVLPPPLLKFLSPLCLSASRHSSNCCRTARFSVPSRERKTGRNTESNQKNKIVSRVQLLKSKCWRKERIPDIFGAVTRIVSPGWVYAKKLASQHVAAISLVVTYDKLVSCFFWLQSLSKDSCGREDL